jgi:hypothetical protein
VSAPTIGQIVEAVETRLETISGLRTAEYVPDAVNPPQAVVDFSGPIDYHQTFVHGKQRLELTVIILVSRSVDRIGSAALAAYASTTGTNSIHAAIEGDATLGGIVDDCTVAEFRRLGQEEIDGLGFYGGVFTLHVIAPGI